jgi:hypothetical protein
VEYANSGTWLPGLQFWFCHGLAVWPWTSHLISLFSFVDRESNLSGRWCDKVLNVLLGCSCPPLQGHALLMRTKCSGQKSGGPLRSTWKDQVWTIVLVLILIGTLKILWWNRMRSYVRE